MCKTNIVPRPDNLQPCPFCGCTDLYVDSIGWEETVVDSMVCCVGCCAEGPLAETDSAACDKWNARAGSEVVS